MTFRGTTTGVEPIPGQNTGRLRLAVSPNPSAGAVRFAIAGGRPSVGVLRIFDLSGRRVMERAVGFAAGMGQVEWDGRDPLGAKVPAGVYLATCALGSERCTARVTVIK